MEIGKKLKEARVESGYTQETVSEIIMVSRQTISNWENQKSYPDIESVIRLSTLYNISLDRLLKGDGEMIKHLSESTNTVSSNRKLIIAISVNILLLIIMVLSSTVVTNNIYFVGLIGALAVISTSVLFFQIIKKI